MARLLLTVDEWELIGYVFPERDATASIRPPIDVSPTHVLHEFSNETHGKVLRVNPRNV